MSVLVVIITYNAEHWIHQCLNSIDISRYDVLILDNMSQDATVEIIENDYPQIRLVCNSGNLGFGGANNIGLEKIMDEGYDYAFLLNQDAWLLPNTIDKLIELHQNNSEFWILSPLQMNSVEGSIEKQFNKYLKKNRVDLNCPKLQQVDFVNAALWLVSRKCIEIVGGFDPLFPHYGEDNDYVNRVHYWGGKIGVLSTVIGYHDRMVTGSSNFDKKKYQTKLVYVGYLKDLNYSMFINLYRVSVFFIRKLSKAIITSNWDNLKIHCNAFGNAVIQWKKIRTHRLISFNKEAFLN